jgi:phage terminase large subunit-like protein
MGDGAIGLWQSIIMNISKLCEKLSEWNDNLQKNVPWVPHKGQQEVIEEYLSGKRDIVICAGRRWGKSAICAFIAIYTFLEGLDKLRQGKITSLKIWIIAPTYELTQKVFEYFVKWYLMLGGDPKTVYTKPFPHIKIKEGFWIQCKSADNPVSLLGEELDLTIIDEASKIPKNVYERQIFPTTTSRGGKTIFISTPSGQNWFYQKWLESKEREDGASFQFPSKSNPTLKEEEWERAKKILPDQVFKQEYEASFLPDAAGVFRGIREIVRDDCLKDVIAGHRYVMGVDLGKHEDFTVLTVIDQANNNVVFFDRFQKIDYPFQRQRIIATAKRYNNARVTIDSTSVGEPIKDDLERDGLFIDDFNFSNKSKKELIEKGSIYIEQKHVWIPFNTVLIEELEAFGYEISASGNVIYGAPSGFHDDCVISLCLAIWGLVTGEPKFVSPIAAELAKVKKNKTKSFI